MGQILLVQGQDPESVSALYRRACNLFRTVHGVTPSHESSEGSTAVARFQPLQGPTRGFFRERDLWAASAGAWLRPEREAEPDALADLAFAFESGADLAPVARSFEGYFLLAAGRASGVSDAVIITDRLGALHAYRATIDGCLVIATSAFVLAALRSAGLDPVAAREFLCTGSVFEQRSLFEGVEKLAAASIYRLRGGQVLSRETWFDLRSVLDGASPTKGDVRELADSLIQGVRSIFRVYRRPLLDLTGGIDTRNILAAARRLGVDVATVVNGPDEHPDVVHANRIARALNLNHRQQVPGRDYQCSSFAALARASALCDGELSVLNCAPVAAIQERTAPDFDVSVGGTLGEIYHGSGWHKLAEGRGDNTRLLVKQRFVEDPWADRMTRGQFSNTLTEHFCDWIVRASEGVADLPVRARADYLEVLQRSRWAGRFASATLRIRPCVAPFVFERFFRASLSAPPEQRLLGRMAVELAEHLDPELAALPLMAGFTSRPHPLHGVRHVVAKAVLNTGGWLSEALADRLYPDSLGALSGCAIWSLPEVADLLRPDTMLTRDLYDERFLRSFLGQCRKRRSSPAPMLGRILSLELAMHNVRGASTVADGRGLRSTGASA